MLKHRIPLLLVALAGVLASGSFLLHRDTPKPITMKTGSENALAPLPAGPPETPPTGVGVSIARADLPTLVKESSRVFIGRVVDIGGSEVVSPAGAEADGESLEITRHRVRLSIERMLRGDKADAIDVSLLDISNETTYPFEIGRDYLIFGKDTELGSTQTPGLVPLGYQQGIFEVTSTIDARNDVNGAIDLDSIAAELQNAG